jgi:hypothetical protein
MLRPNMEYAVIRPRLLTRFHYRKRKLDPYARAVVEEPIHRAPGEAIRRQACQNLFDLVGRVSNIDRHIVVFENLKQLGKDLSVELSLIA